MLITQARVSSSMSTQDSTHRLPRKPEHLFLVINESGHLITANTACKKLFQLSLPASSNALLDNNQIRALLRAANLITAERTSLEACNYSVTEFQFQTNDLEQRQYQCTCEQLKDEHEIRFVFYCLDVTNCHSHVETIKTESSAAIEHNAYLSDVAKIASEMLSMNDMDLLLNQITVDIVNRTVADGAYLHMVHETEEFLEVVAGTGPLRDELMGEIRIRDVGFSAIAWKSGETQYTDDYYNHEACVMEYAGRMQALAIPLKHANTVLGVAFITCSKPEGSLYENYDLLHYISEIAALAIAKTNMLRNTSRELKRSRTLSELSAQMYQTENIDTLLDSVSHALITEYSLVRISIYRSDDKGKLVNTSSWSRKSDQILRARAVNDELVQGTIAWWSFKHGESAFIARGVNDARETAAIHKFRSKLQLGCTLCLPIVLQGKVWGVFVLNRGVKQQDLQEGEVHALSTISHQLSAALIRQELVNKVQHQAFHDSLTNLPNRRLFEKTLKESLLQATCDSSSMAVIFLDLNGFKTINDTLGHTIGDQLLKRVADRLRNQLQGNDTLCRMGGDEFAIVVTAIYSREDAVAIAERLTESFDAPFNIEGTQLKVATSMGISYSPEDGSTVSELLRNADIAMHQAKSEKHLSIQCFNQALAEQSRKRLRLEQDLRQALDQRQFELYYQPQINCIDDQVVGAEALIRWNHPEHGMISPVEFIPVAEEAGLITSIGAWVLDQACEHLAGWHAAGQSSLSVSVNIAAPQFLLHNFADLVLTNIHKHNLEPRFLELEVTESIVMGDLDPVIKRLGTLQAAGIKIAIDDFGTGYSSLSYLQDLPVDILKIDSSFVKRLSNGNALDSLVHTIMLLAFALGLETVAEGVETAEQLNALHELGCNRIQGFYYSRPIAENLFLDAVTKLNQTSNKKRAA